MPLPRATNRRTKVIRPDGTMSMRKARTNSHSSLRYLLSLTITLGLALMVSLTQLSRSKELKVKATASNSQMTSMLRNRKKEWRRLEKRKRESGSSLKEEPLMSLVL